MSQGTFLRSSPFPCFPKAISHRNQPLICSTSSSNVTELRLLGGQVWEGGLSSDVKSSSSMTSVPKTKGRLCAYNRQHQVLLATFLALAHTPCVPLSPFIYSNPQSGATKCPAAFAQDTHCLSSHFREFAARHWGCFRHTRNTAALSRRTGYLPRRVDSEVMSPPDLERGRAVGLSGGRGPIKGALCSG